MSETLTPLALARIGGLPVETLRRLQDVDALDWATTVIDAELRLADLAEQASSVLHPLIGENEDREQRQALIRIRRNVFNRKRIGLDDLQLVETVDTTAAALLRAWVHAEQHVSELLDGGAERVQRDLTASREALRELLGDENLRSGLQMASPVLAAQVQRYVEGAERSPKKLRRFERSVMGYLARSTVKPSPFSTFTTVQLVRPVGDGDPIASFPVQDRPTSRVRVNVAVVNRITALIVADPQRRQDVLVEPTAGWSRAEDRIRYVRRWVSDGRADQAVTFDSVTDKVFFLRSADVLNELLEVLAAAPHTFAQAQSWLQERHGSAPEPAGRYLEALIDVGVVEVPQLHVDVHANDPWAHLVSRLYAIGRQWADELAGRLEPIGALLDSYAAATDGERAKSMAAIRAQLTAIFADLGEDEPQIPRTVVYEDVLTGPDPVDMHEGQLRSAVIAPLHRIGPVLRAFDLTLAQRLTLKAFFVSRYGSGGSAPDLLTLLHQFQEDFFDQYQSISGQRKAFAADGSYTPEVNWLKDESLERLDLARTTIAGALREHYRGDPDAVEIDLGADLADRVGSILGVLPPAGTTSHLVQTARSGGQDLVVLNNAYQGLHFPFSRFAYAFDGVDHQVDLAEDLRRRAADLDGPEVIHAEVTGGLVTSNLNLHPHLVDHHLVCPGERSSRPPQQQIHLDDLIVEHDAVQDRLLLRSRSLGAEIVPTYLGYLIPLALPEIPRNLLLFARSGMTQFDPWAAVPPAPDDEGMLYRPRVRCGPVVLRRRSWSVQASDLPLGEESAAGEADLLLRWQRYRRRHGLPGRVFASVRTDAAFVGAGSSKPIFVDLASVLSLQAFAAALSPEAHVTFTEMLPDLQDAPARGPRGHHAVELAIESQPRTLAAMSATTSGGN